MKKLVIAEKPNLGRTIAVGLQERFEKRNGYLESENYIVTWGFGHLFGLIDIEEYFSNYDPSKRYTWKTENLPFYPDSFRFELKKTKKEIDEGVKQQFLTIKKLLERNDIEYVIHSGDADREGEIIVRLILQNAGYRGKVMRLWEDDQTPTTLGNAIRYNLHPDSDYDLIANEGFARTYIDWLYGINLTRYVSVKAGTLIRVGRVINAIVKAIYDRDMEIKNFKPKTYFTIEGQADVDDEVVKIAYKERYSSREEAEAACALLKNKKVIVSDIRTEEKELSAGKLFSITKLQNIMGKRYKMAPDVTLANVQKLYEKGFVTYPRTSSEYLADGDKSEVESILELLRQKDYDVVMKEKKAIFDSAKVESHGALRPTKYLPDMNALSESEKKVYQTIFSRFLAVFCKEPCIIAQTTITISIENDIFEIKGMSMVQKGWQKYEESDKKEKLLPPLQKGQFLSMDFKVAEKETSPPKHYTITTLNNFMENPFKKSKEKEELDDNEDDSDDYKIIMSGLQIGTGATRGPIINNAIQCGYITLEKDVYKIADNGVYMVETLEKLQIHIDKKKTAEFGAILKKVSKGILTIQECVDLCKKDIDSCFAGRDIEIQKREKSDRISLGKCPICEKDVYENEKAYSCSGYYDTGCDFAIWKNDKYLAALKKPPTSTMVMNLLKDGQIRIKTGQRGKRVFIKTLTYVKKENGYWGWETQK